MESNFSGAEPADRDGEPSGHTYTADEALAVLGGLQTDSARLAERIITPQWYHPVLGLVVTVLVIAQALPGAYSTLVLVPSLIALVLLPVMYARKYGVTLTRPTGARTKRLLYGLIALIVLSMVASVLIKLSGASGWWVCIPAIAAFAGSVILGRRYDDALRHEISASPGEAS